MTHKKQHFFLSLVMVLGLVLLGGALIPSAETLIQASQSEPTEPISSLIGYSQPATDTVQIAGDVQAAVALEPQRVVVALKPQPPGMMAAAQANTLVTLAATDNFESVHVYENVPGFAAVVDEDGLAVLQNDPNVQAVDLDAVVTIAMDESRTLIGADRVQSELGVTGAGVNVAVLDTGIDVAHTDLSDDIVVQKCFNRNACPPNGEDESSDAQDENGHGSHVAGIITGRGATSPLGVAPDAGIVAIRVLNRSGSGWASDIVAGLDWLVANRATYNIRVANLSLTSGLYNGACDTANANTLNFSAGISAAQGAGIITFAASGNDARSSQMGAPACVVDAVSVGSVYDADVGVQNFSFCRDDSTTADQVSCFSNSSAVLDFLAPGSTINAANLGGGQQTLSGTSMASPHAAAVAALMLQANPNLTVNEIKTVLRETGRTVVDGRTNRVTPRIDAFAAVSAVLQTAPPTATPFPTLTPSPTPSPTLTPTPQTTPVTISLKLNPTQVEVNVAATAETNLEIDPVTGLAGMRFEILFDEAIAEVVDADPTISGVQIGLNEDLVAPVRNLVTDGVADVEVTFKEPESDGSGPANGADVGTVASITWQGLAVGQSDLVITKTQFSGAAGQVFETQLSNGALQVTEAATPGPITGSVLLQGRSVHQGITITVSTAECPSQSAGFTPIQSDTITTTDSEGRFSFPAPTDEPYQCLQATYPGFVFGQKATPADNLGLLVLPAGDINGDGRVNIFDLVLMANEYDSTEPSIVDVNNDGVVNIFDLVLVSGNYDLQGPTTNWQSQN